MTLETNPSSPQHQPNSNAQAADNISTAPAESYLLSISPPPTLHFHTSTSITEEEIRTEMQISKDHDNASETEEVPLLLTPSAPSDTSSPSHLGTGQLHHQKKKKPKHNKQDPTTKKLQTAVTTTISSTSAASSLLLVEDKQDQTRAKNYGTSLTDDSFSALLSKGLPPAPADAASTKFTQWQTMYQQFAYYLLCKKWQITLTASLLLFVASLLILVTQLELKLPRAFYALTILTSMSGFIIGSGMFICNTVLKYDTSTSSFSLKHRTLFNVLVSCLLLILVTYLMSALNTAVLPVSVKPDDPLARVYTIPWILCFAPLLLALFVFIFMNVESFYTRYKQATRDNNFRSKNASLMKWNGFLCFALLCITSFVLMLSIHWETPYYKPTLFLMLSFSPLYLLEFTSIIFYLITTVLNFGKFIADKKRGNSDTTASDSCFFMVLNPQSSVERRMLLLLIIVSPSMITAQLVVTLYGYLSHWVLLSLALPLVALYSVVWLIMYEKEDNVTSKPPEISSIAHIIHADFAEVDTTITTK